MRLLFTVGIVVVVLARTAPSAGAQAAVMASANSLYAEPGERAIATLRAGARVTRGAVRGAWVAVTVDGFLDTGVVRAAARAGVPFPVIVKAPRGAVLRSSGSPSADAIATLQTGMGVAELSRRGGWIRVSRSGWVPTSAFTEVVVPRVDVTTPSGRNSSATAKQPAEPVKVVTPRVETAPPSATAPTPTDDDEVNPPGQSVTARRQTSIRRVPDGSPVAAAQPGAPMTVTARDRGWVRVRVEGWVRESEIVPQDSALRLAISAADIRADPNTHRGRTVRWDVQFIAVQKADPLRRDLAPDEPYMLARGPGDENAIVYLALPPSLVATARALPPLASITVTARVRVGRSEPVGVPILDVQSISRR